MKCEWPGCTKPQCHWNPAGKEPCNTMNCEWATGCNHVAIAYIVAGCLGKHLYENFFCETHLTRYKTAGHSRCSCGQYLAEYMYKHIDGKYWHLETTQGSWNL